MRTESIVEGVYREGSRGTFIRRRTNAEFCRFGCWCPPVSCMRRPGFKLDSSDSDHNPALKSLGWPPTLCNAPYTNCLRRLFSDNLLDRLGVNLGGRNVISRFYRKTLIYFTWYQLVWPVWGCRAPKFVKIRHCEPKPEPPSHP